MAAWFNAPVFPFFVLWFSGVSHEQKGHTQADHAVKRLCFSLG